VTTWLQISAGHGPEECTWVVARLVDVVLAEAAAAGVEAECVEAVAATHPDTLRSAVIELADGGEAFAEGWTGSVLWVGESPLRPHHRRHNWFVQATTLTPPADEEAAFRADELEVSAMRSSGAGGQNVNKRSTAVRIRHRPSGLEVVARNERTQAANRKAGLLRLGLLLRERAAARRDAGQRAQWDAKGHVERGNPRRVFRGAEFAADERR
jgi:peptide chain release factor